MRHAFAIGALFCAFSATAWADGNTGLIYGRVLMNGTSAAPCPMIVTVSSNREPPQRTRTATDGTFHFLSVMPGPVTLSVGRVVIRDLIVSANLQNADTYVRPIYVPRPRRMAIHVTSSRPYLSNYCP